MKIEALSSEVHDLAKLLEQKNQENKSLIEEKASISQLQEQHSIELAKQKTKLDDAHKHYRVIQVRAGVNDARTKLPYFISGPGAKTGKHYQEFGSPTT